jgi:hypothetical protein
VHPLFERIVTLTALVWNSGLTIECAFRAIAHVVRSTRNAVKFNSQTESALIRAAPLALFFEMVIVLNHSHASSWQHIRLAHVYIHHASGWYKKAIQPIRMVIVATTSAHQLQPPVLTSLICTKSTGHSELTKMKALMA